jgi:YggT family protein
MPSGYFTTPLTFIVDVLFGLYIAIVALRLIMQWAQWEYHNPIVQMIIKVTQVPVKWLRRYIPPYGKWDTATLVLLIALTSLKLIIIGALQPAHVRQPLFFAWLIADIFSLFITLFSASIIIQVILSWVTPVGTYNPVAPLVHSMNSPLLRPFRRLLPPIAGIDLSPLFALLALQVLSMLVMPLLIGAY